MSIYIRESDWDDPKYDTCGSTTHYILEINNIRVPLCNECFDELVDEIEKMKKERTEANG